MFKIRLIECFFIYILESVEEFRCKTLIFKILYYKEKKEFGDGIGQYGICV